jgi:formiminoglutamate deiminase
MSDPRSDTASDTGSDPETVERRVWFEYALLPTGVHAGVLVSIDGGLITAVDVGTVSRGDAELIGGLTFGGFANAHSHAFHRALRGRTHTGAGDFWTWREQMYALAGRLNPDNYLDLARATFAEMVLAGYTCVGEFHYVHHGVDGTPYDDANAMGAAIIEAARQAGIRLTLLDACYLRGGAGTALRDAQRRFSDRTAEAWSGRVDVLVDDEMVRIGAAIHSVRAVDAPSIVSIAEHTNRRGMPLHAHVSEQVAENEQVMAEHGCSPTALLAKSGALSPRFTAVHATHLTLTDVDMFATARCTCCFCPTTERDLADGIGPSATLRRAGVALAIGSDQHAVIDPFEEMRGIEMDERLGSMRRGTHPTAELLAAGTTNGYRSLGWGNGGSIAVGQLADLTTVSLNSVRLAGYRADAAPDAVLFGATAADVSDVIIGGRTVVRSGAHTSLDVAGDLRRSIEAVYAP